MLKPNIWNLLSIFFFHEIAVISLFPSKYRPIKTWAIWGAVTVLCAVASWSIITASFNGLGLFMAFGISIGFSCSIVFFLSSYSFSKTFFLFLAYAQVFMSLVFISGLLSYLFFDYNQLSINIIRSVLHIAFLFICATVIRDKFESVSQGITRGWWPLNVVNILLMSYVSVVSIYAYSAEFGRMEILFFFMVSTVTVTIYFLFFHTIRYMQTAVEVNRLELSNEFHMKEVEAMQEYIDEASRIRHDARHHNIQIAEYVHNGEIQQMLEYLHQYEEESQRHVSVRLCENRAANNILNAYGRKAEQNGIVVRFDVSIDQNNGIKDVDIVAILANIMENAILGCMRSEQSKQFIELSIGRKAGKLVIQSHNTTGVDVDFENGLPKSKYSGGIGVSSIVHSVKNYGGETDFKNENGVFICRVLLNTRVYPVNRR